MSSNSNIPTIAVKAVIEQSGRILLLQRNKATRGQDNWDLPGGLIEDGQSDAETLHRETDEELGIEIEIIKPIGSWHFVRHKDNKTVTVKNFLCKVASQDFKIKLSNEHSTYQWINPKDIADYELKNESLMKNIYKFYNLT